MSPVTWWVVCRVCTYEQYSCYVVVDSWFGFSAVMFFVTWFFLMLTWSRQEFDGTIFDRKSEFYYFTSMNFMDQKRILHGTADVLKSHGWKLHSATDVRLELLSVENWRSLLPLPEDWIIKKRSQSRTIFGRFTLNVLIIFIWVGKKLLHQYITSIVLN